MSFLAVLGGPSVRTKPFPRWPKTGAEDGELLLQVLQGAKWGRHQGQKTKAFEDQFANYQGARFGIGVFNGSVAIRLALQATGVAPGAEVIVPPYTFFSTASSVVEVNAIPVFADIHPETYCLDPAAIEAVITPRTRAIVPVHFAGQAAAMDDIMDIARRYGLIVIEDAAHAHGSEYHGKRLGSFGDMSTFSFQASKTLTCGEGGMILTSNEGYEKIGRSLHTCGRFPESAWYEHHLLGGNYRMNEFQAALLIAQFSRLEEQVQRREANGLFLNQGLAAIPGIRPLARGFGETRHGYALYVFRYDTDAFDGLPRQKFVEALVAEGVPVSTGYDRPLYRQPVFVNRSFQSYAIAMEKAPDYKEVLCPVSERACQEACWLPHSLLLGDERDMQDIIRAVVKVYENRWDLL